MWSIGRSRRLRRVVVGSRPQQRQVWLRCIRDVDDNRILRIDDGLIRLSVGIEEVDDLIDDLVQALEPA